MLGSFASDPLPTGDPGTPGPATRAPGASPPAAVHEPAAADPVLLRARGGALVEADDPDFDQAGFDVEDDSDARTLRVDEIAAQLAPIRSHESLASAFAREANPDDVIVRAAYARVWADLARIVARRTTRHARIRAMTPRCRPRLRRAA